ncbi:MAG TPA: hypothetical protein VIX41_03480, partial [Acidimicrobiales bacterium]
MNQRDFEVSKDRKMAQLALHTGKLLIDSRHKCVANITTMEGATEASASARHTSADAGPAEGLAADHAPLRVAVAGTGFIGVVHAHAARRAGARLVGVAASSAASAREAAQ